MTEHLSTFRSKKSAIGILLKYKKSYRDMECSLYMFKLTSRSKLSSHLNYLCVLVPDNIALFILGPKLKNLVKELVKHNYSTWEINVQ